MPDPSPVLVSRTGAVSTITLNRPEKLNAFIGPMHKALKAAFDEAADDSACRAILLTGAGRGFCAGQDLNERKMEDGQAPDLGASLSENYNPLVLAIRSAPKPVVCAVNGVAAGAGANIALACDIVLAARSAKFIQAFSRIGLVPDAGGSYFLPRLIGDARARALFFLGEPLLAEDAAQWGLIWKAVDDADLMPEAEALAARLAERPTRAFALMKQGLLASGSNTLEAQLALEADLQREAGYSEDYRIGVKAFRAGETPQFIGR
jgi:2-(1,2-epoxy-1,2-dihydrophenyl)acetyl-CoA isomerase